MHFAITDRCEYPFTVHKNKKGCIIQCVLFNAMVAGKLCFCCCYTPQCVSVFVSLLSSTCWSLSFHVQPRQSKTSDSKQLPDFSNLCHPVINRLYVLISSKRNNSKPQVSAPFVLHFGFAEEPTIAGVQSLTWVRFSEGCSLFLALYQAISLPLMTRTLFSKAAPETSFEP